MNYGAAEAKGYFFLQRDAAIPEIPLITKLISRYENIHLDFAKLCGGYELRTKEKSTSPVDVGRFVV